MSDKIKLDLLDTHSPWEAIRALRIRYDKLRHTATDNQVAEVQIAVTEAEVAVNTWNASISQPIASVSIIYNATKQMERKLAILLMLVTALQVSLSGWTEEELTDMAEQSRLQAVQVIGGEE